MASASAERTPVLQYEHRSAVDLQDLASASPDSIARLGDQLGALDVVDVPLDRFAHVDQRHRLARVQQLAQLARGDRGVGRGSAAASRTTTPQNAS